MKRLRELKNVQYSQLTVYKIDTLCEPNRM